MKSLLSPLIALLLVTPALAGPPANFDQARDAIPHGKIQPITYPSKSLGFDRPAVIYTPPGFDKAVKYPVLYLLHGVGDDEQGWNKKGNAAAILDNLYADPAAKMTPMIVVMPMGFAIKAGEKVPDDRDAKMKASRGFDADLLDTLIPYVDSNYPTLADPGHRALAGLSMGGGQSLRIGLAHPELFSWIGCFSASMREPYPEAVAKNLDAADALNGKLKLLYIACGKTDKGFEPAKAFAGVLEQKKVTRMWTETAGAHEWPVWKLNLWDFAPRLFK